MGLTLIYHFRNADGTACEPNDVCSTFQHCDVNASCTNDPTATDGFTCACNPGYTVSHFSIRGVFGISIYLDC